MANRRMITGDMFEDEFIGELTFFGRLLWIGLITSVADDQGRMMDNPALIRTRVFLFDDVTDAEVENVLRKIANDGKIERYVAGNKRLIQIVNWWKYQTPAWASASKYPAPPKWTDRAKYHAQGNTIIKINWDKIGGYIEGYVAPLHSVIEEVKGDVNGDDDIKGEDEEEAPPAFSDSGSWSSEEDQRFNEVRRLGETRCGITGDGANAIKAIDEIVAMGAMDEDVQNGIDWLIGEGKTIRYFSQLVGPTRTAMQKRIQGNGNGHKKGYVFPPEETYE